MNKELLLILAVTSLISAHASAKATHHKEVVSNSIISEQKAMLTTNTAGKGFGPQAPRDIDNIAGTNKRLFAISPASTQMNLCNIHFHKNAEHKGGEFTEFAGNGDGHGYQSGYKYAGVLSASESKSVSHAVCPSEHSSLSVGDTIEVHYVYSTAQIKPGPTLNSCFNDAIKNPQLRVETQVYVVVNDKNALDFGQLTQVNKTNDLYQASNIPSNTGTAIQYTGSTTGPGYNEKGSPYQVTWNVRPKVAKVQIETVGNWCKGNDFNEDHAHGVRNLVTNPELLSTIER